MKTRSLIIMSVLVLIIGCACGCGKGWDLDYGKPEAMLKQNELATKGKPYLNKMIAVKGIVEKIDNSDPDFGFIYLTGDITCKLSLKGMVKSCKKGDTVYVKGFLKKCEEGDIVLDPAILRDPKAPFNPKED